MPFRQGAHEERLVYSVYATWSPARVWGMGGTSLETVRKGEDERILFLVREVLMGFPKVLQLLLFNISVNALRVRVQI